MNTISKQLPLYFILCTVLVTLHPVRGFAGQTPGLPTTNYPADTLRDGSHDFDFNFGNWHTHIRRLRNVFTDSSSWVELNGTVKVRKVWNGKAQLEEIEADGPFHFEGTTLFLYNPAAHQWSQNFASSSEGVMETNPTIGSFKDGVGELYAQSTEGGRSVLERGVWSDIKTDSHTYSIYLSNDGGKNWTAVFIAHLTRDTSNP
jgi:hypothetical protein